MKNEPKLRHMSITVDQQGPGDPRPHWGVDRGDGYVVVKLGPVYVNVSTWSHMQRQSLGVACNSRFRLEVRRWDGWLERRRRRGAA